MHIAGAVFAGTACCACVAIDMHARLQQQATLIARDTKHSSEAAAPAFWLLWGCALRKDTIEIAHLVW